MAQEHSPKTSAAVLNSRWRGLAGGPLGEIEVYAQLRLRARRADVHVQVDLLGG